MNREETNVETGLEIAVLGMAGRFPGARNINEFWDNLKAGVEAIQYFNDNELERDGKRTETINNPDFIKTKGGVLEEIEYFDASFFSYTPMEAEHMAPQIRVFHECLWEALEDAGYGAEQSSRIIGLYAGASSTYNWELLCSLAAGSTDINPFMTRYLSNRDFISAIISYKLNLNGPVFSMHTACSTSLVAIHLACQGLLASDCDMALAGGVALNLAEGIGYFYQEGMILSADGHCRAFDTKALGTICGEGAGLIVLKRLEDAVADRDHIYAVIKGSAINNDGNRKVGFTAPSIEGQVDVILKAQLMAELEPEDIGYIETHGTGTPLGDVTEVEALRLAFNTDKKNICGLGALKTNIGHLDTAAGVTAVIKTILAIQHRQIPPTIHFEAPNPRIDLENSPFYLVRELKPWDNNGRPLRAGVSSFGIGGTNAHVVLEEWTGAPGSDTDTGDIKQNQERQQQLILLSAKSETALQQMTEHFVEFLQQNPEVNLADTAYTLQVGRKHFPHRRKLVCSSVPEAIESLSELNPRKVKTHWLKSVIDKENDNEYIVFMFPGLGAEYVNMGLELYQSEFVFRREMDRCFSMLEPLLEYDLKGILYPGDSVGEASEAYDIRGEKTGTGNGENDGHYSASGICDFEVAQLVTFILEYSLARLLMTWGIKPRAMIGYSFGEYAAACLSGIFTLEDALRLLVIRGRLINKLPRGMMLNVPLPTKEVQPLLNDECCIGIDNGSSCVVSGAEPAVQAFHLKMKQEKVMCLPLDSSSGIHSSLMTPILEQFEEQIKSFHLSEPRIPFISSLTADWIVPGHAASPAYWVRQLRETVRFYEGIHKLLQLEEKGLFFLELGPGRDLATLVNREKGEASGHRVIHLIRPRNVKKEMSDARYFLDRIGLLWVYGASPDWQHYYSGQARYRVALPTYPFERQRFWKLVDDFRAGKYQGVTNEQKQPGTGAAGELAEWFYLPVWKRRKIVNFYPDKTGEDKRTDKDNSDKSCWLVFTDDHGLGKRLTEELKMHLLQHTVMVKKGPEFVKENKVLYTLHPGQYHHYQSLLEALKADGLIPTGIIHLWGVTAEDDDRETSPAKPVNPAASIYKDFAHGFYSILYLAKALGSVPFPGGKIEINVITDHMQAVYGEENLCPGKSAVLGPCLVIPQEYPHLTCKSIDISHWNSPGFIREFLKEITGGTGDRVVAFRGSRRWIQTFEPVQWEKPGDKPALLLRKHGVYLIIGGLGDIGSTLAEYLVKRYDASVILTGRSPLPDRDSWGQLMILGSAEDKIYRNVQRFQQLQEPGNRVFYFPADIADAGQMKEVMRRGEEQFGPIHGVIHSAGIISGETFNSIASITDEQCQTQFLAKLQGLLVLEEVFGEKSLDFCLLISSISTVLGGLGFTAYAAANHFMDTFACQYNQREREPWIIVDWDGTDKENTEQAFHYIFSSDPPEQVVFSNGGDLQGRISRWVKLDGLSQDEADGSKAQEQVPMYSRPELSNAYVAPRNSLEQRLANIWQRFFGIDKIGVTDDLYDLGGDSLKAINIISIIHKEMSVVIPIREFFNHSTIEGVAGYLRQAEKEEFISIAVAEKKEYYALSSAQQRLYILQQLEKNSTVYNSPQAFYLEGQVDREQLERIIRQLIKRHDSLRTSIGTVNGVPVQVIHEPGDIDFTVKYHEPGDEQARELILQEFVRPFDLSSPPFLRLELLKVEEAHYILMFDIHHIVTDGISYEIFVSEFATLFAGQELPLLPIQYKDYSEWLNHPRQQAVLEKQQAYWLARFQTGDELPVLVLPYDYPRPKVQDFAGERMSFEVTRDETRVLRELAAAEGTTLYMVLLTIFNIFLTKLSNQEDIVVGSPVVGRQHKDLETVLGVFINTLPIRNYPASGKTVQGFLKEVRESALQAFDNQGYPFEDLVEKLAVNRDTGRSPLFDVLFVLQISQGQAGEGQGEAPVFQLKPYEYESRISKFDLTLEALETAGGISCRFEYCTSLFRQETVQRFTRYFKRIIGAAAAHPQQRISGIDILSNQEKQQILVDFNRTEKQYPAHHTIYDLFAREVEKNSHRIALVGSEVAEAEDTGPVSQQPALISLTYRQLHHCSGQLANRLRSRGVETNTLVGIIMERSIEMVLGIFAILKAGGAYMPIDPECPAERLGLMIRDSQLKWLLSHHIFSGKLADLPDTDTCQFLDIHALSSNAGKGESSDIETNNVAADLAYVIYTSGSTGKPKGVMVEHSSITNTLFALQSRYPFKASDTYLLKTSYIFDVSLAEIFGWFFGGGRLSILAAGGEKDPAGIMNNIEKQQVTHINFVPSMFNMFIESLNTQNIRQLTSLKYIFLAGEAIMPEHLRRMLQLETGIILENIYGPTEAAIYGSWYSLSAWDGISAIPIGKPLYNVRLYILRNENAPQPIGVPGELCISGAGVARGYLNRPELTSERFVNHKSQNTNGGTGTAAGTVSNQTLLQGVQGDGFLEKSPPGRRRQRLYKTGDLARWLGDGNIEFIGRIDHQVKVRGFRVELGEIENKLLKHDKIKEAIVTTGEMSVAGEPEQEPLKKGKELYLCSYFVSDIELTIPDLKEFLLMQLPEYMVPAYFIRLEQIPLTPTGKVDRKRLPSPFAGGTRPQLGVQFVAPRTGNEKLIAGTWREVLKLEKIGIHDNFFDLGGNSLKLIQVNNKLNEALNREIPMVKMFEYPTIHTLLNYLGTAEHEGDQVNKEVEQLDIKHDEAVNIMEATLQAINEE